MGQTYQIVGDDLSFCCSLMLLSFFDGDLILAVYSWAFVVASLSNWTSSVSLSLTIWRFLML